MPTYEYACQKMRAEFRTPTNRDADGDCASRPPRQNPLQARWGKGKVKGCWDGSGSDFQGLRFYISLITAAIPYKEGAKGIHRR